MKATDSYRLINESPLKGIILYYSNVVLENIKPVKLKTVISEIQTGKTPPKANSKYYQSQDIDWFKPSDIGRSKYLEEAEEKFSEIALKEKKGTLYPKNTLLIIGIGGGVGRVSLLRNEGSSNQQITGLLFNDEIFPEWAYYYYLVREDYVKSQAKSMSFPILNQAKIKNLDFKYPSKNEQIEVCKFLDHCWECYLNNALPEVETFQIPQELKTYTIKQFSVIKIDEGIKGLIENQKGLITELKQAVLQEAIQGKLTVEWREQNPDVESASELLKRIKAEKAQLVKEKKIRKEKPLPPITEDEIPFELPEDWVWCRLGEIFQTTSGGTPNRSNSKYWNGSITWYKSGELNDGLLSANSQEKITELGLKESSATLFPEGTLLIAMYGATAGKLAILGRDATTNQAVCGFYKNQLIESEYLFNFLMANRSKMISESWGMSQPNISQTYLKNFVFALPPLGEQKRIVKKVKDLMKTVEQLKSEITQSEKHAQMLMQAVLKEAFESKKEVYAE